MIRHDLWFLCPAVLCLACGVAMGVFMGVTHDFTLTPVHAHVNLLGWASLSLFAVIYRAYPQLSASRAATVHVLLCVPSALSMPAGLLLAILYDAPALAIAASMMWLAGCLTFLGSVVAMVMQTPPREVASGNQAGKQTSG